MTSRDVAQHAMLYLDGIYLDASGPGTLEEMVGRINESAGRDLGVAGRCAIADHDLEDSLRELDAARVIAHLLTDTVDEPVIDPEDPAPR